MTDQEQSEPAADVVALYDQAHADVRQKARVVGAYCALRDEGVDDYEACRLTLAFQRRLIFPEQEPQPTDPDCE